MTAEPQAGVSTVHLQASARTTTNVVVNSIYWVPPNRESAKPKIESGDAPSVQRSAAMPAAAVFVPAAAVFVDTMFHVR